MIPGDTTPGDAAGLPADALRTRSIKDRRSYYEQLAKASIEMTSGRRQTRTDTSSVSVVLRTADRPRLLAQALASLANQSFGSLDVVLVVDGPPPPGDLLDRLAPLLHLQVVVLDPPQGRTAALNAGLGAASGEFVTYLDDDDILYPFHVEALVRAFDKSVDVAYTLAHKVLVDETVADAPVIARLPFHLRPFDPDELLVDNFIPLRSIMHRARCINEIGCFDETFDVLEDWEFVLRLNEVYTFTPVRRFTWDYRFRATTASRNAIVAKPEQRLSATQRVYSMYPVQGRRVARARAAHLRALSRQIEVVRKIRRSDATIEEQSRLLAASVGGFPTGAGAHRSRSLLGRGGAAAARFPLLRAAARRLAHVDRRLGTWFRALQGDALEHEALIVEREESPRR